MEIDKILNEITKLINTITNLGQHGWFDYIQLLFTISGVLISALAVWTAINIPKKIANNQDKIALFDKRFNSFDVLQKYIALSDLLKDNHSKDNYSDAIIVVFFSGEADDIKRNNVLIKLIEKSTPLKYIPFLFKDVSEKEIEVMIRTLCSFVAADLKSNDVEKYKQLYIYTVENFCTNHYSDIKKEMKY